MPLLRELKTTLRGLERDRVYGAKVVLDRDELRCNATAVAFVRTVRSELSCTCSTSLLVPSTQINAMRSIHVIALGLLRLYIPLIEQFVL